MATALNFDAYYRETSNIMKFICIKICRLFAIFFGRFLNANNFILNAELH